MVTDISGFFENIDHGLLVSDLRSIGVPGDTTSLLRTWLDTWIQVRRGLPQSNLVSHLFAKLYLHGIDQQLEANGFVHARYVDDLRLFCRSATESKRALQHLIRFLRDKTLTIQTAKTTFMNGQQAEERFRGATPLVERVSALFETSKARERAVSQVFNADYMTLGDLIRESADLIEIPIEVIVKAYEEYVLGKFGSDFNKTTFHYLVGQLTKSRNSFAVDDCLTRFVRQPQETRLILRYCRTVKISMAQEAQILDFLEHDENIYAFQTHEILEYFSVAQIHDVARIQSSARRFAFGTWPLYLRSQSRFLLFRIGANADRESLLRTYAEAESPVERAELICALSTLETGRRNAFYNGVNPVPWIVEAALTVSKAGRIQAPPIAHEPQELAADGEAVD